MHCERFYDTIVKYGFFRLQPASEINTGWRQKMKRVFLTVLGSFGTGEMEDAESYGDEETNTLLSVSAA